MQTEKEIARRRGEGNAVGAVGGGDAELAWGPGVGGAEGGGLLQSVAAGVGPGDDNISARRDGNSEVRRSRRLHGADKAPEAAGDGINAAGHHAGGVVLADGSGEGVLAARTGAAAARDFIPVN